MGEARGLVLSGPFRLYSVWFLELLEFFAAFVAAKIKRFLFPGQGQSLADRDIGSANRVLDHFFYGLALAVEAPRSRCGPRAFEQPFKKQINDSGQ